MSRAAALTEVLRSTLQTVDESCTPGEADAIYTGLVAHIRARRPESVSPLGMLPPPGEAIRDPRVNADHDIPWPDAAEMEQINRRNVEAARLERTQRYAVVEWPPPNAMRYCNWHSRTHADLLAHATRSGLHVPGETVRLGWVDRDSETGEAEYTWLEGPRG